MQNFNFLKAFCLETATNCLPFFKKPANINYDAVDNSETTIWNSVEEKEKLKNDIWNDPNKSTIELNTMIPANTNEIPVNRAPKNSITADKSKLIGNINEDQIKKIENSHSNEPDYFQTLKINSNDQQVNFNNVINSQTSKIAKSNLDKGFNEKFKLEENIEPGSNWLDEQDIKL